MWSRYVYFIYLFRVWQLGDKRKICFGSFRAVHVVSNSLTYVRFSRLQLSMGRATGVASVIGSRLGYISIQSSRSFVEGRLSPYETTRATRNDPSRLYEEQPQLTLIRLQFKLNSILIQFSE